MLFVLSHIIHDPNIDLPGKQVLGNYLNQKKIKLNGKSWQSFKNKRKNSTALSAPIFYGPGLKALRWMTPAEEHPSILIPSDDKIVQNALCSFEKSAKKVLSQTPFNTLENITVKRKELKKWSKHWPINKMTKAEQDCLGQMLTRTSANFERATTVNSILKIKKYKTNRTHKTRKKLCEFTSMGNGSNTGELWLNLQYRQLFRFSLESLLYWITSQLLFRQ